MQSYFSIVEAIADCIGEVCPQIGVLYRSRLNRLRTRLEFDPSPASLDESAAEIVADLREYSARASRYVAQHEIELKSAVAPLDKTVGALADSQELHGERLRELAADHPQLLEEIAAMTQETKALVARMRDELAASKHRLEELEITDRLTGLMNRREIEREIGARNASGRPSVLIQFELHGASSDEVLKQAGARLESQFRHKDLVGRWSANSFMVLFHGPADIARLRAAQVVPWVAGRYLLDNGESAQVSVEYRVVENALAA